MKFREIYFTENSSPNYYHGTSVIKGDKPFTEFKSGKGTRSNGFTGHVEYVESPWVFVTKTYDLAYGYAGAKSDELRDKTNKSYIPSILLVDVNESKLKTLDLSNDDTYEENLESIDLAPWDIWGVGMYDKSDIFTLLDNPTQSNIIKKAGYNSVLLYEHLSDSRQGVSLALDINDKSLFKIKGQ